jgi:hypothetical protein
VIHQAGSVICVDLTENHPKDARYPVITGLDHFAAPEKTKPGRSRAGEGSAWRSAQAVCTNMVSTIGSDTICTNMVSTISSNAVGTYVVSAISGNAVGTYVVSAISSNAVGTYVVSAISSNAVGTNMVSTVSGKSTHVGMGRTIFCNDRRVDMFACVYSGKCKSARSQKRESEAEDQFVSFHGSCSRSIQISG